jgi:hypothetical protein
MKALKSLFALTTVAMNLNAFALDASKDHAKELFEKAVVSERGEIETIKYYSDKLELVPRGGGAIYRFTSITLTSTGGFVCTARVVTPVNTNICDVGPRSSISASSRLGGDRSPQMINTLTCEQEDGDQWIEAKIVNQNNGLRAVVTEHNVDDESSKILANLSVFSTVARGGMITFSDSKGTFKLTTSEKFGNTTADLSVLFDGPNSISQKNLVCFKN